MSRHVELHRAIVLANLGHNAGCNSTACPLRKPDPTIRQRIVAFFRRAAEQPEGSDRGQG